MKSHGSLAVVLFFYPHTPMRGRDEAADLTCRGIML
jgi:hypothetical protein